MQLISRTSSFFNSLIRKSSLIHILEHNSRSNMLHNTEGQSKVMFSGVWLRQFIENDYSLLCLQIM